MSDDKRFSSLDIEDMSDPAAAYDIRGLQSLSALPEAVPGTAPRNVMHDPQQPDLLRPQQSATTQSVAVGTAIRVPGIGTAVADVEPAVLEPIERFVRHAQQIADPASAAASIIAEARENAQAMLQQARDVITAEREQARTTGYKEGYDKGIGDADAETADLISTCEQIGMQVIEERQRVLADNEADVVNLALVIAQRIVAAELSVNPEIVIDSCRSAMRKAFQRESMQVRAHPDDLHRLREAGPKLADEMGGIQHLEFVEERRVTPGSVIISTPAGEIDGTIEGKQSRIEETLREGIEARRAEMRNEL